MEALKENEIRIGNLLQARNNEWNYRDTKKSDVIDWASTDWYRMGNGGIDLDFFMGIPLTEEWLLKFGFEKIEGLMSGCVVYQKGYWRLANKVKPQKDNSFSLWHERVCPPTWNLSELLNVHQLQNLYFALTGEELTIKN